MSTTHQLADGTTIEILSDESAAVVAGTSNLDTYVDDQGVQLIELPADGVTVQQTVDGEDMIVYMTSDDTHHVNTVVDSGQSGSNLGAATHTDGQTVLFSESAAATNVISGGGDSSAVELIQISSLNELTGSDNKVWRLMPGGLNIASDAVVIVNSENQANITKAPVAAVSAGPDGDPAAANLGVINTRVIQRNPPPDDAPQWAKVINDCEKVGHYYRGWVPTEQDLDIILTLHKQQTASFWGTRQSTDSTKAQARLMWKSQYVPYDGIPFVNCGSRATVMECQYGPRRKGAKPDPKNQQSYLDFKQTCPARIYVKKVKKFPDFGIPLELDKKAQKVYMDKAFQSLRAHGCAIGGEERYYMQLPLVEAHEYHIPDTGTPANSRYVHHHITKTYNLSALNIQDQGGTRLVEPVANKIRELVSSGIQHVTTIRKMLRKYVDRDLFADREPPVRHDLSYFPTVSDLKNHIHTALTDIENGTLPLREASMDSLGIGQEDWGSNWTSNIEPHPETVTVTLTQGPSESGHVISKVETHMSDGSTQISTSLTQETAALLVKCNPNLFPCVPTTTVSEIENQQESQKITNLVQSVLTKTAVEDEPQPTEEPPTHPEPEASNIQKEASEPTPPTEGVQLDLGLSESHHGVTEVILEGVDS